METKTLIRRGATFLAAGAGLAAGAYATYAAVTWMRYGKAIDTPAPDEADDLLDRFMPRYEVVERHQIHVAAPPEITLAAAKEMNVLASPIARGLFKARAWVLGGNGVERELPAALADQMQAIGWRVLAEVPGREIVFGAVTKPWQAEPEFRGVPGPDFLAFNDPDFVKILWTLRADPVGDSEALFRSETRVCTTDAGARSKFRRYWAFASPGVALIRRVMLTPIKVAAERRAAVARLVRPAA